MIAYTLSTLAFLVGLGGLVFFGTILLDRAVRWNDQRRDRAERYRSSR